MQITFKDLTWDEVKENVNYIDNQLQSYINDMDVLYDVTFIKDDIMFTFIFQYDELESINVCKK